MCAFRVIVQTSIEYSPGLQGTSGAVPGKEKHLNPAGHGLHAVDPASLYVPEGQACGGSGHPAIPVQS